MLIHVNGRETEIHEAAPARELGDGGVAFALRVPDTGRLYTLAFNLRELEQLAGGIGSDPASAPADGASYIAAEIDSQRAASDAELLANNRQLEADNPADAGASAETAQTAETPPPADPERPA